MPQWEWFGHFAVRIRWSGGVLYIDPFQLREKRCVPAELVLLTNPRVGHLSREDIDIVRKPGTVVAGPPDCVREVGGSTVELEPGTVYEMPGLRVTAVPAYTVSRSFFPRSRNWLGYLIDADGRTFYHAGATDRIPEMRGIGAEVAFLPVSGRYVMDGVEAGEAGRDVGAETRVGTFLAGDRFFRVEGFVTRPAREARQS